MLPLEFPPLPAAGASLFEAIAQFEAYWISAALVRANQSRTLAAESLGLNRTTLVAKMRVLGMPLHEYRKTPEDAPKEAKPGKKPRMERIGYQPYALLEIPTNYPMTKRCVRCDCVRRIKDFHWPKNKKTGRYSEPSDLCRLHAFSTPAKRKRAVRPARVPEPPADARTHDVPVYISDKVAEARRKYPECD